MISSLWALLVSKYNYSGSSSACQSFSPLVFASICLLSISLKFMIGFGSFSGHDNPPIYGDFEAQRHWMEITVNLPISEWYTNSSLNDLNYWGLDYPPLTAYHSYLCGKLSQIFCPDTVALLSSRGSQSYETKLFMRLMVLLVDVLILLPVSFLLARMFCFNFYHVFVFVFLNPSLLLIDSGHFQFNNFSIGLCLFSLWFMFEYFQNNNSVYLCFSSVSFVLSLSYKQMELIHAPFFFITLLSICFKGSFTKINFTYFFIISTSTFLSFFVLLCPFVLPKTSYHTCFNVFFQLLEVFMRKELLTSGLL
ncbi:hypothetical protein GEMRC1_002179 [Eukaryota sp. GEM-RC1]